MKRLLLTLGLVVCSAAAYAQTDVLFWPQPVPLVTGRLEAWPGNLVSLESTPGTYVSVQPDGRLETRTAVHAWELATRIGPSILRFDGAGTPRYLFLAERTPPPVVVVVPDPTLPPENIRTTDPAAVSLRVTYWLTVYGHLTDADHAYWMGIIFDTLYHEGHAIGWTADSYWPDLMRKGYKQ